MLNNKTQHAEYGGGSFLEPFQRDVVISFSCRGYELLRTPACICSLRPGIYSEFLGEHTFRQHRFWLITAKANNIRASAGPSPHCVTGATRSLE